jgi:hypothetical protein
VAAVIAESAGRNEMTKTARLENAHQAPRPSAARCTTACSRESSTCSRTRSSSRSSSASCCRRTLQNDATLRHRALLSPGFWARSVRDIGRTAPKTAGSNSPTPSRESSGVTATTLKVPTVGRSSAHRQGGPALCHPNDGACSLGRGPTYESSSPLTTPASMMRGVGETRRSHASMEHRERTQERERRRAPRRNHRAPR